MIYEAAHLNVFLTEAMTIQFSVFSNLFGHFWVFLLKIQWGGGSLTAVILKCLLTLETKTSNHSLSADVFYCSKKLNDLDAFP